MAAGPPRATLTERHGGTSNPGTLANSRFKSSLIVQHRSPLRRTAPFSPARQLRFAPSSSMRQVTEVRPRTVLCYGAQCGQCTSEAKDSERETRPLASTSKPLVTTTTNFQFRGPSIAPRRRPGPGPGVASPQPEGRAWQEPGALPRRSRPKWRRCQCACSEHHGRSGPLWRRLAPTSGSGRPSAIPLAPGWSTLAKEAAACASMRFLRLGVIVHWGRLFGSH